MKKIVLILALAVLSVTAHAYDAVVDGIYYNLRNGEAEVTCRSVSSTLNQEAYSGTVSIPDSVTVDSIAYPVTTIGIGAFYGCSDLTDVVIPETVTTVWSGAFWGCTSLPVVDNIRYAGCYMVEVVDKTQSAYTVAEGTRFIGAHAFTDCPNLTTISLPQSVTSIGAEAFMGCSQLTAVSLPDALTAIEPSTFYGCASLTALSLPQSVTTIGNCAFAGCSSLTAITLPQTVASIGYETFRGCAQITAITIPEGVTTIGRGAFADCTALTTLHYNARRATVSTLSNALSFPTGLTQVNLGNEVETIPTCFVQDCTALTTITLPPSVSSIGTDAFMGCELQTIVSHATDPEGTDTAFSVDTRAQAMLYLPEGTPTDAWSQFANIKEMADEAQEDIFYMLADASGRNYTVYDTPSQTLQTVALATDLDETALGCYWVLHNRDGILCLYNEAAQQYAGTNADGVLFLSASPVEVTLGTADGTITLDGRPTLLVPCQNDDITPVQPITPSHATPSSGKYLRHGRIEIVSNGHRYDTAGQRIVR